MAHFKQRLKNQWTQDLGILTLKDPSFWIKRENTFKTIIIYDSISVSRVALWDKFGSLLEAHQNELTLDIAHLDRINHGL